MKQSKKKALISTSTIGLTAMALAVAPAMANAAGVDAGEDEKNITQTVDIDGATVDLDAKELTALGLPKGDFTVENQDEKKILVVDVLDEDNATVVGEKTILKVENEGVWTFATDTEGNLVKVDFEPAEDFTGDPTVDYRVSIDELNTSGKIMLDYPNVADTTATNADDTTLAEVDASDENLVEDDDAVENTDGVEEEKADETTSEATTDETTDSTADETTEDTTDETTDESSESPKVMSQQARAFAAAPAAPIAPAEDDETFDVPDLKTSGSKNGTININFGSNGGSLPSNVDKSSITLVVPEGDNDSSSLKNGKEVQTPMVGEWAVNGSTGFTFTPYSTIDVDQVKMEYNVMDNDGFFSNRGTITVDITSGSGTATENPSSGTETPSTDTTTSSPSTSDSSTTKTDDSSTSDGSSTSDDGGAGGGTSDDSTSNGNGSGDGSTDGTTSNGSSGTSGESSESSSTSNDITGATAQTGGDIVHSNTAYIAAAGIAGLIGAAFIFAARRFGKNN